MNKVTGEISCSVWVSCPHCGKQLNLNSYPYDENDDEGILGLAIFGSVEKPAKWDKIDLTWKD